MLSNPLKISLFQVYKDYKAVIHRKLNVNHKPWMRHKEMDIILATIRALKPKQSLEWGSGYSSLYFPSFIPKNAQWLALEHESKWAQKVQQLNKRTNVKIKIVGSNVSSWKDDGTYEEFKDYVEYPEKEKFDLIIIDGRARRECVIKSKEILSSKGVVFLHDANRRKYHSIMDTYEHTALFTDHRSGYGGIWIGSKNPLYNVINVKFHQQVWASHRNLSRFFSFKRFIKSMS